MQASGERPFPNTFEYNVLFYNIKRHKVDKSHDPSRRNAQITV